MGRIKVLDKVTADQIAAGEVVQRPVSVVKELVENSIDAGAGNIDIDILHGGTVLIRIADDGIGFMPEDIPLSVLRHATSKIARISDLDHLSSLGFRGEALASIASVSKLKIVSLQRESADDGAVSIEVDGGICQAPKKAGRAPGTTVEVNDLFFNVPARRKFLKKEITEFSHIADIVEKFIISNPEIKFKLTHNNKTIYNSPGNGKLYDAISSVFPKDISKNLVELDFSNPEMSIRGYVGNANCTRTNKSKQLIFVNRRYIQSPTISKAMEDAYRNLLELRRYPVGVIFITIDPAKIDVNVHPAKREIKFENTSLVYTTIKSGIASALNAIPVETVVETSLENLVRKEPFRPQVETGLVSPRPMLNFESRVSQISNRPVSDMNHLEMTSPKESLYNEVSYNLGNVLQILDTYLVIEHEGKMLIYDQHALHERILFEKLKVNTSIASQKLLVPEMVFLSKNELLLVGQYIDVFTSIGFELETFGEDCIMVRAVPDFLTGKNCAPLVKDIMSDLVAIGKSDAHKQIREKILKFVACRGAVKAGDKLSYSDINRMFKDAQNTPDISTCPHGRPTEVSFSQLELEKMFHRK